MSPPTAEPTEDHWTRSAQGRDPLERALQSNCTIIITVISLGLFSLVSLLVLLLVVLLRLLRSYLEASSPWLPRPRGKSTRQSWKICRSLDPWFWRQGCSGMFRGVSGFLDCGYCETHSRYFGPIPIFRLCCSSFVSCLRSSIIAYRRRSQQSRWASALAALRLPQSAGLLGRPSTSDVSPCLSNGGTGPPQPHPPELSVGSARSLARRPGPVATAASKVARAEAIPDPHGPCSGIGRVISRTCRAASCACCRYVSLVSACPPSKPQLHTLGGSAPRVPYFSAGLCRCGLLGRSYEPCTAAGSCRLGSIFLLGFQRSVTSPVVVLMVLG